VFRGVYALLPLIVADEDRDELRSWVGSRTIDCRGGSGPGLCSSPRVGYRIVRSVRRPGYRHGYVTPTRIGPTMTISAPMSRASGSPIAGALHRFASCPEYDTSARLPMDGETGSTRSTFGGLVEQQELLLVGRLKQRCPPFKVSPCYRRSRPLARRIATFSSLD
jgi:hypothetical protein